MMPASPESLWASVRSEVDAENSIHELKLLAETAGVWSAVGWSIDEEVCCVLEQVRPAAHGRRFSVPTL